MSDSSWDNGGHGVPVKPGLPLWGKVVLGCGIAFLVLLVTCVGGLAFVTNKIKKDPEGAKRWAIGFAADKMGPDWADFTHVVNQLRTPESTQALYEANPDLATTWPDSAAFLKDAETWRKNLPEVPPFGPELISHSGVNIGYEMNGAVRVAWHPKEGPGIAVTFATARKAGDTGTRKVTRIEVH